MKTPLHVLHLEDDSNDAALVQSTLEGAGIACTITRTQDRDEFVAALEREPIDLILSDFSLPAFDGISALEIAQARWRDIPLILVSGTLGEEQAIDSLKAGATDYVLKRHLARLVPAVHRAMRDVKAREEHRQLEAQFIEAQKMEAIGQLALGVAHDFNNILAVVMGYSDLLMLELAPGSHHHYCAEEIQHASERAAGLTRQLLIFSRQQTIQPVVLDLDKVVRDLEKLLRRTVNENIAMTIAPGTHSGHIKADAGHVGQVLMNLVVNARDAMPNGGTISIATQDITLDADYARTRAGVAPGDYVMFSVSDTGTGMTEDVKARLFEAFFTTKPVGKGTGLGLATCRSIVRQSGGHIDVESEPGKGTTFKIYFPRVEPPPEAAAVPITAEPLPRGQETLLIVEDEPSVRHLARGALEAQGYQVLSASSAQDALHVAHEHRGAPIRLLITGVVLRMDGRGIIESLKVKYPDLQVLTTSDYMDETEADGGALRRGMAFLAKPYAPSTLTRKVREMLDRPLPLDRARSA